MSRALTARVDWRGHVLEVDFSGGQVIGMELDPHGAQPSFFAGAPASARPLAVGNYIGDVRQGGSCNAEVVELIPHCHGTHTECRGHILDQPLRVQHTIYAEPCVARLVSLAPTAADGDAPQLEPDVAAVTGANAGQPGAEALVIRTLPNDVSKCSRDYARAAPYPVLGAAAMAELAASPLKHLLVDTPSLDPADDNGRLANHRTWWGMGDDRPPAGLDAGRRSVTEMVFVPNEIADGLYWLHLELSPLLGDATPSRPVLFPLRVQS